MSQTNNISKEGKIVLLIIMFFVILAVVTIALVVTERNSLRFLSPSSISEEDKVVSRVSDAEKEEISEGLNKIIAGKVVSIDKNQRSLVIDEDPFGQHKELKISTTNKTKVSIIYEEEESTNEETSENEGEEQISIQEDVATEKSETDFDFIEVDRMIEVTFAKRVDIDSSDLVAEEIVILPN